MASAWNKFVADIYRKNKKGNPNYKFKDALKDAAPLWKNGQKSDSGDAAPTKTRRRSSSRKSRKSRRRR